MRAENLIYWELASDAISEVSQCDSDIDEFTDTPITSNFQKTRITEKS